jgi:predicted protein tyrosine phosphatase
LVDTHHRVETRPAGGGAPDRGAVITMQDHRYFCPARGKWTRAGAVCHEAMRPEVCAECFENEGYFREILSLTEERLAAVRRMRVVVLSHYMADELAAVGVPRERVHVIPPFVHGLDLAAEPDGPPCVAFVGRLVEAKGVLDAVEAWRLSGIDLPLVFAGTGPLRDTLERGGFDVRGWLSHGQLSRLLARARAVLMPSRWQEPFGIAGLEALSMGVPVVAWKGGGIGEWHPGPLVEWGDVAGLAGALRAAVATRATPAPGFDRDRLMARLVAVYQTAAAHLDPSRTCLPGRPWMSSVPGDSIAVAGRTRAGKILCSPRLRANFAYLVSIGGPEEREPAGFRYVAHRLRLVFEDALEEEDGGPSPPDIEKLIRFARSIDFAKGKVLVHCQAGISRSAAAAIIILVTKLEPGHEHEAVDWVRRNHPKGRPNQRMMELADHILGADGRLLEALE